MDPITKLRSDLAAAQLARDSYAQQLIQCRDAHAQLMQDKARLDWLQKYACEEGRTMAMPRYAYHVKQWQGAPGPNIRAAIDDAMAENETRINAAGDIL